MTKEKINRKVLRFAQNDNSFPTLSQKARKDGAPHLEDADLKRAENRRPTPLY
jgi:hypothetical protein